MEQRERHIPTKLTDTNYFSPGEALLWRRSSEQSMPPRDTGGSENETSSIRQLLEIEMKKMEAEMERFKLDKGKQQLMEAQQEQEYQPQEEDARAQQATTDHLKSESLPIFGQQSAMGEEEESNGVARELSQQTLDSKQADISTDNTYTEHQHQQQRTNLEEDFNNNHQTNKMSDRESTPSSLINEPLGSLSGANRATTTERRTTTTTTTKRTVKSSDDFIPSATDIQQVRSESRTGSISSSSPIFSAQSTANDLSSHHQQQQASSSTTTTTSKQQAATKGWSEGLQSPLIQDTEEGRVLKLRFDVTQYEPDEIVVKTVDNRLTVHAKHEERSENRSVYREYNREFHLPDGTDVEQIRSSLSKDGVLTVDCPLPTPQLHGASRRIPIEKV